MKKICKKLAFAAALLTAALILKAPARAYAVNITPVSLELYSTSGTPVYAAPDVFSTVIVYLDRFINVRVTGITENGFYRVDLNGNYYIPGPYLVANLEKEKTAKQKAYENLGEFAQAYKKQLEMMESYSSVYALKDVTGDGIPEIIDSSGQEIYAYYDDGTNKRAVMIYYSANPVTLYYSKEHNQLLGKYTWKDKEIWEVYSKDTTYVPWGLFKCVSTDASAYIKKASAIEREYENNAETRNNIYNELHELLGYGKIEN